MKDRERQERLAEELRANLRKRKAQARGRAASEQEAAAPARAPDPSIPNAVAPLANPRRDR